MSAIPLIHPNQLYFIRSRYRPVLTVIATNPATVFTTVFTAVLTAVLTVTATSPAEIRL